MKKRQIAILSAGVAVLLTVGLCLRVSNPYRRTVHLSNGAELSLLAVTRGSNVFFPGGFKDKLVYRFAPKHEIKLGNFKIGPVSPLYSSSSSMGEPDRSEGFTNGIVVWTGHRGPAAAPRLPVPEQRWLSDIRATLADEKGEEWEMPWALARPRTTEIRSLNWVTPWDFSSFPRRGRILRFRIYARTNLDRWETLAEFTFPNPTPGPYPVWKSPTLPFTQKQGDLEVSLISLVSGTNIVPNNLGVRPVTKATFEVKERGQVTEAWVPDRMEARDATGNEVWFVRHTWGATNRLVFHEIQTTSLSPSEVWRVRVRFAKEQDPAWKPIWKSPRLPVSEGALSPVNLASNVEACRLSLVGWGKTLTCTLDPNPPGRPWDHRVQRPIIVDNRGRPVECERMEVNLPGFEARRMLIPPGAEWITVTVGLVETRWYEFVGQPTSQ